MAKKRLNSVCCFWDFRILKKSKHIRQSFSDNRETPSDHFVSIPISTGFRAVGFFINKIFMFVKPIQKFFYPILFLRFIVNEMQFADNFPQLEPRIRLWIGRKPYFAHSLNMDQTPLNRNLWADFSDGFEQRLIAVAGYSANFYSQIQDVFQILLHLPIMLPVSNSVKLGLFKNIISENNETNFIGKISPINQQINFLVLAVAQLGNISEHHIKIPLKSAHRISRFYCNLLISLFTNNPFFKPNFFVFQTHRFVFRGKINATIFTFKTTLATLFTPRNYLQTFATPTTIFFEFSAIKKVY